MQTLASLFSTSPLTGCFKWELSRARYTKSASGALWEMLEVWLINMLGWDTWWWCWGGRRGGSVQWEIFLSHFSHYFQKSPPPEKNMFSQLRPSVSYEWDEEYLPVSGVFVLPVECVCCWLLASLLGWLHQAVNGQAKWVIRTCPNSPTSSSRPDCRWYQLTITRICSPEFHGQMINNDLRENCYLILTRLGCACSVIVLMKQESVTICLRSQHAQSPTYHLTQLTVNIVPVFTGVWTRSNITIVTL